MTLKLSKDILYCKIKHLHFRAGKTKWKISAKYSLTCQKHSCPFYICFFFCMWSEKYLIVLLLNNNCCLYTPLSCSIIDFFFPSLSTPAGCSRSAVSILDRTANDGHLQAYAASGRQSCVPVQGECSADRCDPFVVQCSLNCPRDNGSDSLTHVCDRRYRIYKDNCSLCDSGASNC